MKKICCLLMLSVCLLLSACSEPSVGDPFGYIRSPFTLTVKGELCLSSDNLRTEGTVGKIRQGKILDFSAEIASSPLPAGIVEDGLPSTSPAYRIVITYTAPEALAGLSITCTYGGQDTATIATLTRPLPHRTEPLSYSLPFSSVQGLLLPATAFFPDGDVSEVSPVQDHGIRTVKTAQAVYTFSKDSASPTEIETSVGRIQLKLRVEA